MVAQRVGKGVSGLFARRPWMPAQAEADFPFAIDQENIGVAAIRLVGTKQCENLVATFARRAVHPTGQRRGIEGALYQLSGIPEPFGAPLLNLVHFQIRNRVEILSRRRLQSVFLGDVEPAASGNEKQQGGGDEPVRNYPSRSIRFGHLPSQMLARAGLLCLRGIVLHFIHKSQYTYLR